MLKLVTKETKHIIEYMGAKFEVVPLTKERHKDLIEKHTSYQQVKKSKTSKPEYEERTNWVELTIDKIDEQVLGWSGIEGNPECNSENKRSLANRQENKHICSYLLEAIDDIGAAIEEEKEKKKKN